MSSHCCAVNCKNSRNKGYKIYAVPNGKKDPLRRQIWLNNINRNAFSPQKSTGLCKEHFDSDQFERMIPGKLKPNAIPTVFNYNAPPARRKYTKRQVLEDSSLPPAKRVCKTDQSREASSSDNRASSATAFRSARGNSKTDSPSVTRVRKVFSTNALEDDSIENPLTSIDPQDVDNSKRCLSSRDREAPNVRKISVPTRPASNRHSSATKNSAQTMKKNIQVSENYLGSFLNPNQIKTLNMSAVTWSEAAIKKALQLRFSCGLNGYNVLREQGLPLPTDDILRWKLEPIPFKNGLVTDIFQILQSRVQSFEEHEKRVSLMMDEIAIQPSLDWDERSESIVGLPTVPKSKGEPLVTEPDMETKSKEREQNLDLDEDSNGFESLAKSVIVFTVRGVASSWKQIIAYEFIGDSYNSTVMKDILLDIMINCHVIGLDVKNVTMDLLDGGQTILKHFGIMHGRIGDITNIVPHPVVGRNKLQFFASFPHLLKGLRNLLSSGEEIFLPDTVVTKYNLPTCLVNVTYVQTMITIDEQNNLRLVPQLKLEYLNPRHFEKMNVSSAQCLFSQETVNALRFLVSQALLPEEALSTAWFFEQISTWYETVTSRSPTMALSRFSIEKLNGTVKRLNDFISLILNMNIGRKNAARKRIQKEIYIATSSVAMIKNDFLNAGDCVEGYNQNCLENLLCLVRFRNYVPTALEFKNSLRVFSLFQLLKGNFRQNCVVDPSVQLPPSLLHHLDGSDAKEVACIKYKSTRMQLTKLNENSLYSLCVYCVTHFIRYNKNCDLCVNFLVARGKPCIPSIAPEKCYSPDMHTFACVHAFRFLEFAEKTVLDLSESMIGGEKVVHRLMEQTMLRSQQIVFPSCHQIKEKLLKWYLKVRLFSFLNEDIDVLG